jgi:phage shock protein PspC (stress-responsive transcriptional regulator)
VDQQTEPQTASPARRPRRFLRAPDDRLLGGVCGGLGRYFNVDPLLFRVGTVAFTFIGGVVLIVYAALWVLVPTDNGSGEPSGPSPLRRLLGGADGRIRAGRLAGIAALGVGALLAALLLAIGAVWVTASGGGAWIAGLVIALGLAAAVGALAGRRRTAWLLVPALLIAAPAGFAAAADVRFQGGFGEPQYRPTAVSALPPHGYKLAAGRLRVDLRGLALSPGSTTEIPIQLGMGVATIIVPASVCVQSDTKIGAGYVDVLGDSEGGLDVRRGVAGAQGSTPRVLLHATVGIGALEVVHRPEDALFLEHRDGSHRALDGATGNSACGGASPA